MGLLTFDEISNDCNDHEWFDFLQETFPDTDFTLELLILEASESAGWRGHTIAWRRTSFYRAVGSCKCGAEVICLRKPQRNQINIGGPAVGTNCVK